VSGDGLSDMDSDEIYGMDNSGNLLPLDPNLLGVVGAQLAVCTRETFENLHNLFNACGHANDMNRRSVLAICARVYEAFYSANFLLQMRAGATLGLQVRAILESAADIIGFAEDPEYLRTWICQEKRQWDSLLAADQRIVKAASSGETTSNWESMSRTRLKDFNKFCKSHNLSCDGLPSGGGREKILLEHSPTLALDYKFLCVNAHNRPTSLFSQHAPNGPIVIFVPTNRNLLEYYVVTMLQAWEVIAHVMSKIWLGDVGAEAATRAIISSINKTFEEIASDNL
jgi:hypothetical protein